MRNFTLTAIAALVIVISYWVLKDYQQGQMQDLSLPSSLPTEIDCDLGQGPCIVNIEGLSARVSLEPLGLPALKPLVLTIQGDAVHGVVDSLIWFDGRDMEMGRHYLEPADNMLSESEMSFNGMIPVCSVDENMIWKLHLAMRVGGGSHQFVFELPAGSKSVAKK